MVSDEKTFDLMKKHVNSSQYGYKCECILVKVLFRNIKGGYMKGLVDFQSNLSTRDNLYMPIATKATAAKTLRLESFAA